MPCIRFSPSRTPALLVRQIGYQIGFLEQGLEATPEQACIVVDDGLQVHKIESERQE